MGMGIHTFFQQFSFCFSQRYDPFVVGPLGPEKSPEGDTTNGICGIINRKMRIADISLISAPWAAFHIPTYCSVCREAYHMLIYYVKLADNYIKAILNN